MSFYKIRPKAGTKEQWETANTVLAEREIGFEFPETGIGKGIVKMKMGDGKTAWKDLPYAQVVPLTQADVLNIESTSITKPPSAGYVKEKFDALNSALVTISQEYITDIPGELLSSTGWKNITANKITIPAGYEIVGILPKTYTYKMSAIQGIFYDTNNISFNFYLIETISEGFNLRWRALLKKME